MAKVCDDYFVPSLEILTKKLKISEDVSGATFMAIGSSAPELFTAIIALTKIGAEDIGSGTIVGSAIFNILVIVGASAVVAKAVLNWRNIVRDLGFYILSILLLLFTFWDGIITQTEALFYMGVYALYLLVLHWWGKNFPHTKSPEKKPKIEESNPSSFFLFRWFEYFSNTVLSFFFPNLKKSFRWYGMSFFMSVIWIAILSYVMVELALHIAHELDISEAIIALTILAAGTSIPDLLSSVIASKRGYSDMAVSNAIGSNTFDILVGLGLPWSLYIVWKGQNVVVGTENLWSSIVLLFSTVLVLFFLLLAQKFKLTRIAGAFLIFVYVGYLAFAISLALGMEFWR
jgi:K+-dependent Na+/Ca+ exchanger-like protein